MNDLKIIKNDRIQEVFEHYPAEIKPKMTYLRTLILETAKEIEDIHEIEETLKWGEPSYLVKKGSTIRIDWKKRTPHQYAIYFKCTSKLVSTFKAVFADTFKYEKNRAILFNLEDILPKKELKQCISLALRYHSIKHLDHLGMNV